MRSVGLLRASACVCPRYLAWSTPGKRLASVAAPALSSETGETSSPWGRREYIAYIVAGGWLVSQADQPAGSNGLSQRTSRWAISPTLRVTSVRSWCRAVAANSPSTTGIVRPAASLPQFSAIF